jgi:hypothetical protein
MYEYIFPGLALDETKAFASVKPLHCSLFFAHFFVLFSSLKAIWCFVNRSFGLVARCFHTTQRPCRWAAVPLSSGRL